jgi:hypothetical protein
MLAALPAASMGLSRAIHRGVEAEPAIYQVVIEELVGEELAVIRPQRDRQLPQGQNDRPDITDY